MNWEKWFDNHESVTYLSKDALTYVELWKSINGYSVAAIYTRETSEWQEVGVSEAKKIVGLH